MKIKMSSNLFSVLQPDMYGVFDSFMDSLEERETEWHYDENRYVIEEGQRPLFRNGDHDNQFVDITELRVGNPEWKEGHYECSSWKACETISKAWVGAFNDRLKERGIKAKARYTAIDRPREYNFETDAAVFEMSISLKEIERLFAMCRERGDFDKFLYDHYKSYDGFWSFLADNIEDWNKNTKKPHYAEDWERSIWQALNFLMWNGEADRDQWSEDLQQYIYEDLDGNGAFNDCLEFVEDEKVDEAVLYENYA